MGKLFDAIDDELRAWIAAQPLFFVATAPRSDAGHVNVSPKGPIGSLCVLGPKRIAYLDTTGSGAETIAHVRENGRIVVMLCAFEGRPRIVRLHGRGTVVLAHERRFAELLAEAPFEDPGLPEARRAIVVVDVTRIAESCGYGVPLMTPMGARPQMRSWGEKKLQNGGPDALRAYRRQKNTRSIDGLPAIDDE